MRFWIGLWVLLILCIIVAFELCYLVEYFTRFTEEVFSVLISLLFIYEALLFLIDVSTLLQDLSGVPKKKTPDV